MHRQLEMPKEMSLPEHVEPAKVDGLRHDLTAGESASIDAESPPPMAPPRVVPVTVTPPTESPPPMAESAENAIAAVSSKESVSAHVDRRKKSADRKKRNF